MNNNRFRGIPRQLWVSITLVVLSSLYAGLLLASFATGEEVPKFFPVLVADLLTGQVKLTPQAWGLGIFFAVIFADLTGRATWHLLRYLTRAGQQHNGSNASEDWHD
ncbi:MULTISPECIES: hypothetical protein [Actinotignum]|uniref:Uncharacterized protein n=1 Tax=Actinotignum schaalii FB123-CNA-2 TaxID=883067 RepID=S2VIG6_9ACTO|nr:MULTISPECIES: hypothetical protein [Actinotignum]EPD27248.1 hypothetical protein HMPREF9237_00605 [Actinotignum schaalii FB123-CNA-2]MDY5126828.1 hypothetical protein [Actinotignum sp. SLA_B059]MDY5136368.1 hypothetical protein [Actinotignum sanguinis]MDY5137769.1 hypothetical protein [Actinotignum timonense]MDY5144995.1 hypothetical protein [Actinotignum timonense]